MPSFSSPDKVSSVIDQMQQAEVLRATQRALLNGFFNGKPIWTEEEAEASKISINFNNKSGAVLLHNARAQYTNAFQRQENYFSVRLPDAPPSKSRDYGSIVTSEINKIIRASRPFYSRQDSVFAGVCLHGVGAKIWWDDDRWCPHFAGIQDILIPTDTELEMDDSLQYFAVKRKMKPGSLFKATFGKSEKNLRPEWNLPIVRKLLDEYKDLFTNPNSYDFANNPEQMVELVKQNTCFYDSDSAPIIWMWDFFFREEESKNPGWYRKIVLDKDSIPSTLQEEKKEVFIYEDKKPCARALGELIHFQFGDGNNVPPFMYHSIRSLAFLTYELLWTMNRLQCQWTQHVFEQMLTLFRITDPQDRSRLEQVVFSPPWGIVPEGLNFVTAAERYTVDAGLVEGLRDEYQGLVSNTTQAYTQSQDQSTQGRERVTKAEIQAKMAQTSQLMNTMILNAYRQEKYAATEIARRFCIPKDKTTDFDVKRFQTRCIERGVPAKWLNVDEWDIEIDQVLGGGNRAMELAESAALMEISPMLDPHAQQEVKHDRILAITGNAKKASRLAPLDQKQSPSDAVKQAEADFTLSMQGIEPTLAEGLNHIEQIQRGLQMMAQLIQQIQKSGDVGTPQQAIGLQIEGGFIEKQIKLVAQDKNQKALVKQFSDVLSKLMNLVRAFTQRQQAAAKKQAAAQNGSQNGNGNGAEIAGELLKGQTKAKISEALAKQKLRHNELAFKGQERRKNAGAFMDLKRDSMKNRLTALE